MSSSKRNRLKEVEEEAGPSKKGGLDVDVDLETLQCPICTEPLSPPVFQCANGHTVCSACCEKMIRTRGCPFCSLPIGHIRCLAIERVVESIQVGCSHSGCTTVLSLRGREEHERMCRYRPIKCPKPGCAHQGPRRAIPNHLFMVHDTMSVECESNNCTEFGLGAYSRDQAVLVKAKEAWVLVSWLTVPTGHWFTCEGVWAPREDAEVKLSVKPRLQVHKRVYSMESALRITGRDQLDHSGSLFIPGVPDGCFRVTVALNCA